MSLEISNINCFYGSSHILHDVSLTVDTGELYAVLGRNGAGKTTLMRAIIGLIRPESGTIRWNGRDITRLASHERARHGIAYVPQGREIIAELTVADNIKLALLARGRRANGKVPDLVYDYFPGLKGLGGRKGGVLSGGQQQQLAIARALVQEPTLLLLDEPTEGLQPSVVEEIEAIIKRIPSERNCAVLLVEQHLDFVREITREFSILDSGHIAAQGAIEALTDAVVSRHLSV